MGPSNNKRLSKRERRLLRQQNEIVEVPNFGLVLSKISPLTQKQFDTFTAYESDKDLMLHGIAGTGKSFLALYLALREIMSGLSTKKRIIIVRSVVPTRDMGFLPGTEKEKTAVYEAPYTDICTQLFGRGDAYEILKNKGVISFISTSYIRGCTMNDAIIIADECNNYTGHELDTLMTRVGKNSRINFCGDFRQSDFTKNSDKVGFRDFMRVINTIDDFAFVDFEAEDIVRSGKVKRYIIAKDRLGVEL